MKVGEREVFRLSLRPFKVLVSVSAMTCLLIGVSLAGDDLDVSIAGCPTGVRVVRPIRTVRVRVSGRGMGAVVVTVRSVTDR